MTDTLTKEEKERRERKLSLSLVRIKRLADHNATLEGALLDEILRAREAGGTFDLISVAAGKSRETLRRMVHRAEEENGSS